MPDYWGRRPAAGWLGNGDRLLVRGIELLLHCCCCCCILCSSCSICSGVRCRCHWPGVALFTSGVSPSLPGMPGWPGCSLILVLRFPVRAGGYSSSGGSTACGATAGEHCSARSSRQWCRRTEVFFARRMTFCTASGIIGLTQNHVVELRSIQQAGQHVLGLARPECGDNALASGAGRHVDRSSGLRLHRAQHLRQRGVLGINRELAVLVRDLRRSGRLLLQRQGRRRSLRHFGDGCGFLARAFDLWAELPRTEAVLGDTWRGLRRLRKPSCWSAREAGQQQQCQPESSAGA